MLYYSCKRYALSLQYSNGNYLYLIRGLFKWQNLYFNFTTGVLARWEWRADEVVGLKVVWKSACKLCDFEIKLSFFLFVHKHLIVIWIYDMFTWINLVMLKDLTLKLFSNTYDMFCFDRLKYRVLTALQRHLCFIDITSYSVSISKALHFISLRIAILKSFELTIF